MTKDEILKEVEVAFKIAEKYYGKTFSRPDEIIFKRNGKTAGYCFHSPSKKWLMFQLDLAEHNPSTFIQTVKHEVAHYVQFEHYGYMKNPAHGKYWKYVMRNVMGLAPERCHTYDTSVTKTRKERKFKWTCGCNHSNHIFPTRTHNKIKKTPYVCSLCKGRLTFLGEVVNKKSEIDKKISELEKLQNALAKINGTLPTKTFI